MNKIRLKKIKKKRISNKISALTFVVLVCIVATYFFIKYIGDKVTPIYLSYAEAEIRKLMTLIINKSVNKQITDGMDMQDIFSVVKNDNGDIQLIEFNSANITNVLNKITNVVQLNLKSVEEGKFDNLDLADGILDKYNKNRIKNGVIYEIPMGLISNSTFLSNLGPKIPVKMYLLGDVMGNINTNVREYGLNNAMIEVFITIEVSSIVNLPFTSKTITVSSSIPISMKVIQGNIPNYYLNGLKNNSNIYSSE